MRYEYNRFFFRSIMLCNVNYVILSRFMIIDCSRNQRNDKLRSLFFHEYGAMPFLKPQRVTWCKQRIEACKRNGWRHAIYFPETKRITKAHYTGQWKNDKREGKGIGVNRYHEGLFFLAKVLFFSPMWIEKEERRTVQLKRTGLMFAGSFSHLTWIDNINYASSNVSVLRTKYVKNYYY